MKKIDIKGSQCKTKKEMFETFAKAFLFPDYVHHNWDSFDEAICDLSWIEDEEIIMHILDFDEFLSVADDEDKDIFFSIISNVQEYSGKVFLLELDNHS